MQRCKVFQKMVLNPFVFHNLTKLHINKLLCCRNLNTVQVYCSRSSESSGKVFGLKPISVGSDFSGRENEIIAGLRAKMFHGMGPTFLHAAVAQAWKRWVTPTHLAAEPSAEKKQCASSELLFLEKLRLFLGSVNISQIPEPPGSELLNDSGL